MLNIDLNVKNWLMKVYVIEVNPSNCECECDKSCDVGEYLDYKKCKCMKKIADKLVEECAETVEEVKIAGKNKCSSSILYIVLFSIFFAMKIGIGIYFVYYKYLNRNK